MAIFLSKIAFFHLVTHFPFYFSSNFFYLYQLSRTYTDMILVWFILKPIIAPGVGVRHTHIKYTFVIMLLIIPSRLTAGLQISFSLNRVQRLVLASVSVSRLSEKNQNTSDYYLHRYECNTFPRSQFNEFDIQPFRN